MEPIIYGNPSHNYRLIYRWTETDKHDKHQYCETLGDLYRLYDNARTSRLIIIGAQYRMTDDTSSYWTEQYILPRD